MSDVMIKAEGLGKCYRLGERAGVDRHLREVIVDGARRMARCFWPTGAGRRGTDGTGEHQASDRADAWHATKPMRQGAHREGVFWALEDISFEVRRGEVLGIIGHNGAGKSTLLKVLSRITEPSKGRAEIRGRVGSLLEVGTGFHPELTGRENIFLNASILGMTRSETRARLDRIVDFSGIEAFLDTPVKRYSSGMYVRLAFSVAAHLDTDILIADEVLAVGDAEFQRKCLGTMQQRAAEGRTVLFVSHNMGTIEMLCSRGIVLAEGRITADRPVGDAIQHYLRDLEQASLTDLAHRSDRGGRGEARLTSLDVRGGEGFDLPCLKAGAPAMFEFTISHVHPDLRCIFTIHDNFGHPVLDFHSRISSEADQWQRDHDNRIRCIVPQLLLAPGRYRIDVHLFGNGATQDLLHGAAWLNVNPGHVAGRPSNRVWKRARVQIPHQWILPTAA